MALARVGGRTLKTVRAGGTTRAAVLRLSGLLRAATVAAVAAAAAIMTAVALAAGPPTEATFFVVSDTHFNDHWFVPELSPANRAVIEAINGLSGRNYPSEIRGVVAAPRGVLVLGDLTDGGKPVQWRGRWFWRGGFDFYYPRDGAPAAPDRVHYPVYALPGNHDRTDERTFVAESLAQRYGSVHYSLDWGPVHLVILGVYADAGTRAWLAEDLARTPPGRPVVLLQHYPFPGSGFGGDDERWWSAREKEQFKTVIEGRGVVAIFHGHAHVPESYRWERLPVFNPGSAEHNRTFAVVRTNDARIDVVWYQVEADPSGRWTGGAWLKTDSVKIK